MIDSTTTNIIDDTLENSENDEMNDIDIVSAIVVSIGLFIVILIGLISMYLYKKRKQPKQKLGSNQNSLQIDIVGSQTLDDNRTRDGTTGLYDRASQFMTKQNTKSVEINLATGDAHNQNNIQYVQHNDKHTPGADEISIDTSSNDNDNGNGNGNGNLKYLIYNNNNSNNNSNITPTDAGYGENGSVININHGLSVVGKVGQLKKGEKSIANSSLNASMINGTIEGHGEQASVAEEGVLRKMSDDNAIQYKQNTETTNGNIDRNNNGSYNYNNNSNMNNVNDKGDDAKLEDVDRELQLELEKIVTPKGDEFEKTKENLFEQDLKGDVAADDAFMDEIISHMATGGQEIQ